MNSENSSFAAAQHAPGNDQGLHGLLPVNKPVGMVSKDVSRRLLKFLSKNQKLGHVGTLDPLASGVLPILLGTATKLQDYLLDSDKSYEFDVTFGYETDSLDSDGTVIAEAESGHLNESMIRVVCQSFLGPQTQIPPLYSAIKFQGKPLYKYAAKDQGHQVPLEQLQRHIIIEDLQLHAVDLPRATFSVRCSKGTYVRSLARDIAEKLHTKGTITRLVRKSTAGIELAQCLDLEEIEARHAELASLLVPVEQLKVSASTWHCLTSGMAKKLRQGQDLCLSWEQFQAGFAAGFFPVGQKPTWDSKNQLFLFDVDNKAFGMASVYFREPEQLVMIHLKRGL